MLNLPTTKHRQLFAILLTCVISWFFAYLAIHVFKQYAFALFFMLPFFIGASTTILYGYRNDIAANELRRASFLALFVFCVGLGALAYEGIICIMMAAPIAYLFTWVGIGIGHLIVRNTFIENVPAAMIILVISVPSAMHLENSLDAEQPVRSVTTSVEINASADAVWKNVVEFPQLEEPTEFLFRTGIAYPINAQIEGRGVGAIRHCNFSTGSFVEPITVWDEPRLLKFDVTDQPEPMKELSPYDIHPNHLHGYWVSKQGQFKLTPLPNGHCLLEGTTWYVNKIKPGFYWTLWSDYIVHAIHERVLLHIKKRSEQK